MSQSVSGSAEQQKLENEDGYDDDDLAPTEEATGLLSCGKIKDRHAPGDKYI